MILQAEGEEPSGRRQEKLVLDCLRKALKIADQCQQTSAKHLVLFVDILNQYVYFYEVRPSPRPLLPPTAVASLPPDPLASERGAALSLLWRVPAFSPAIPTSRSTSPRC